MVLVVLVLVVVILHDRGAHKLGTEALREIVVAESLTCLSLVIKIRLVLSSTGSVADSMRNRELSKSYSDNSVTRLEHRELHALLETVFGCTRVCRAGKTLRQTLLI